MLASAVRFAGEVPRLLAAASDGALWVATGDGALGIDQQGHRQLNRRVGPAALVWLGAEEARRYDTRHG